MGTEGRVVITQGNQVKRALAKAFFFCYYLTNEAVTYLRERGINVQNLKVRDLVTENGEVTLIFDYELGEAGKVKQLALTYMTGTAEEAFSKDKVAKSMGKMATELLTQVISTVEGKTLSESKRRELVSSMFTVDRDLLMLASYLVSFGDTVNLEDRCPKCNNTVTVVGDIRDLSVVIPENVIHSIEVPLFHGVHYADATHMTATIVRPTGLIQEAVTTMEVMKNPVLMKNAILMRIIKRLGDLTAIPPHVIETKLSVKDKNIIFRASNEFQGSVSTEFECTCTNCEHEFSLTIPMEKYFTGE
jgi:hypothetical protein